MLPHAAHNIRNAGGACTTRHGRAEHALRALGPLILHELHYLSDCRQVGVAIALRYQPFETLLAEAFTVFDTRYGGRLHRLEATYTINDHWKAYTGTEIFAGKNTTPISPDNYVRVWVRIPRGADCPICGPLKGKRARLLCGYYLANEGYDTRLIQDYLGHRDANMTARYTRTAAKRFEGLWK